MRARPNVIYSKCRVLHQMLLGSFCWCYSAKKVTSRHYISRAARRNLMSISGDSLIKLQNLSRHDTHFPTNFCQQSLSRKISTTIYKAAGKSRDDLRRVLLHLLFQICIWHGIQVHFPYFICCRRNEVLHHKWTFIPHVL